MSRAKRSKVLARERWRRQVARLAAPFIVDDEPGLFEDDGGRWRICCPHCEPWPVELQYSCIACGGCGSTPAEDALTLGLVVSTSPGAARHILSFDVHAVREAALDLVKLEEEQTAFEDFTRARGLGPENRKPGAFARRPPLGVAYCLGRRVGKTEYVRKITARGGWPGKLTREWPGDSRAPMGRALARLGRRVLEAIEGQPSECPACRGRGLQAQVFNIAGRIFRQGDRVPPSRVPVRLRHMFRPGTAMLTFMGSGEHTPCTDCSGTGHNLRGTLPPIEWSAQVKRKALDGVLTSTRANPWAWTEDIPCGGGWWSSQQAHDTEGWGRMEIVARGEVPSGESWTTVTGDTRIAPRGEHRAALRDQNRLTPWVPRSTFWARSVGDRFGQPDWWQPGDKSTKGSTWDLLPRWRLGELRRGRLGRIS